MLQPWTRQISQLGIAGGNDIVYNDLQGDTGRVRLGVSAPTWRTYNHGVGGGIAFDVLGFAVNNYIEFEFQTSHEMKLNTVLDCHMHYILPNTTNIGDRAQFQLDVIAAPISGAFAVPSGSPFTAEIVVASGYNTNQQLMEIADIPAVNTTISTIYTFRLTRIAATADEYGSEVYLKYVDCHYQRDTGGSIQEDSKV